MASSSSSRHGGGVVPPKPPSAPPPPRVKNSREKELEQLRQRGLARALNKHFTSVTSEIAKERAAADAALKDLEQRRANTSDFQPGQYEQTPWDKIRKELRQKKAECKRKEKETLLLYQRYVNKFGDSGFVALPDMSRGYSGYLPSQQSMRRNIPKGKTPVSSMATRLEDQLEENMKKGGDRLPSVEHLGWSETKQTATFKADKISRTTELRLLESRGVDARASSPGSPSKSKRVNNIAEEGGDGGAPMAPSLTETPISEKTSVTIDETAATASSTSTTATSSPQRKQSSSSSQAIHSQSKTTTGTITNGGSGVTGGSDAPSTATAPTVTEPLHNDYSDEDDRSVVSGLTSVNSQTIAAEADARLLEFLKSETEEIRKMMEQAGVAGPADHDMGETSSATARSIRTSGTSEVRTSYSSEIGTQSQRAAEKAEDMVRKMQKMLTDFEQESQSVLSGSGVVYDDDGSILSTSAYPREYKTGNSNPNEKWMIYYDEQYKKEYYHEVHSGLTQWDKPKIRKQASLYGGNGGNQDDFVKLADYSSRGRKSKSRRNKSRSVVGGGPMITHEDVRPEQKTGPNVSRRDIYRRKRIKRKRRRRIIAAGVLLVLLVTIGLTVYRYRTNDKFANSVHGTMRPVNSMMRSAVTSFMPESSHPYFPEAWTGLQERRNAEEEKKRLEAERKRAEEEERIRQEEERKRLEEEKKRAAEEERRRKAKAAAEAKARKAKEAAELKAKRAKEAAELKAKKEREAAELKAKKEREAAELKAKKEREAAELKAKKEREAAELLKAKQELEAAAERERQERLAEEARVRAEREAELLRMQQETERKLRELEALRHAELAAAAYEERMKRPFFCNIPLLYIVNGRCRRLSIENPMFDLQALSDTMLQ